MEKVISSKELNGIEVRGYTIDGSERVLSKEALKFVAELERHFRKTRDELLLKRRVRQEQLDKGEFPNFLPKTVDVRKGDWKVGPNPADLSDRRVEITGPTDRKMVINALNSGANVFMADFEDSLAPTWLNLVQGQINLQDAVRETITFEVPGGKFYSLNDEVATLVVRPRGWHLYEKHVLIDGKSISAGLFDFGLYFFHNVDVLLKKGTGPYFYLPKLESHLEARLWNDVFIFAQELLGIPRGTIKATVLIEHILAAFEMDEILFELREHSTGLNCGRWDYIFSFIKKFRNHPSFLLPDRAAVTMNCHFLRSYVDLLIQTCHKRGAHAMGGMAAQVPIKGDPEANESALQKVRADKVREVNAGHDGTWVAHPGLVPIAMDCFDEVMKAPNQLDQLRKDVTISAEDLLKVPSGEITESGLRTNISVGIQYMEAWLGGNGCVPLNHLMEDAATAEISRTQIWQWIYNSAASLTDGNKITLDLFRTIMDEELENIRQLVGEKRFDSGCYHLAAQLFDEIISNDKLEEFLTLRAYDHID